MKKPIAFIENFTTKLQQSGAPFDFKFIPLYCPSERKSILVYGKFFLH